MITIFTYLDDSLPEIRNLVTSNVTNSNEFTFVTSTEFAANSSTQTMYVVRDPRDIISNRVANTNTNDVYNATTNLIVNESEDFLGGWSNFSCFCLENATFIVRYEELFSDFRGTFQRFTNSIKQNIEVKKQKYQGWKNSLSEFHQDLFWSYHAPTMEKFGYSLNGNIKLLNNDLDYILIKKMGFKVDKQRRQFKVAIEAHKLHMEKTDGSKRYLKELLKQFLVVGENENSRWNFGLYIYNKVYPIRNYADTILDESGSKDKFEYQIPPLKEKVRQLIPLWLKKPAALVYKCGVFTKKMIAKVIKYIRISRYDLVHFTMNTLSYPFKFVKNRYLVTVHDFTPTLFPEFHENHSPEIFASDLEFIKKQNADVIAVSNWTKKDYYKDGDIVDNKVHTIYEGANRKMFRKNFDTEKAKKIREKYKIGNYPYILCLSTIEPRKNLSNTIIAFKKLLSSNSELNVKLVIAGRKGWMIDSLFQNAELTSDQVIFTGFIENSDLHIIYSEALALSYISHYEGFGLPILEAMSCGTPVIYGDNSSQPEVAGDAGYPANSNSVESIYTQMYCVCFNSEERAEKAKLSLKQSFKFSWRKAAIETLATYEKIINETNKSFRKKE